MQNLHAMIRRLIAAEVEFVLVGGYAAVTYGVSLLTRDVDICCSFSKANLLRLQNALADIHPRHRMTPQRLPLELTDELCASLKNLYLETDLCILDCLSEVAGVGVYEAVLHRSIELQLPDMSIRVLDVDALIQAKEAMNRPHDRITVTQLRAIKERLRNE
jgi:hypothetical protein